MAVDLAPSTVDLDHLYARKEAILDKDIVLTSSFVVSFINDIRDDRDRVFCNRHVILTDLLPNRYIATYFFYIQVGSFPLGSALSHIYIILSLLEPQADVEIF